jgi:uncharacterized LabA/DUF88 family protein
MEEPKNKRAVAFFDGQNLFRHAKAAFGYDHPNYDPKKLFSSICTQYGWDASSIRFYTGTPDARKDPRRHGYWANRLLAFRRSGILVESRPLKYRIETILLPDGNTHQIETAQEKGIDIRIALDIIRLTITKQLDVALIFSQDQDLAEVVAEVKEIAKTQERWVWVASAFPYGPKATSTRGINGSEWIKIDQGQYDLCLDIKDYRPPKK